MPWWRVRSWSTNLDALTRLHKGLLALDGDGAHQAAPFRAGAARPPGRGAGSAGGLDRSAPGSPSPIAGNRSQLSGQTPPRNAEAAGPDPAIAAIKETFRYVAEAGDKAVGFFYGQLFVRQPQLRQLFPPAMDEQRDRLFHALGRIVESLSTPEEMAAYLSQLGRDHRKYRVEPEMYEAVGAALLATLRAFARDAFTTEAEEAWTQVYLAGSSLMIKSAEEDAAAGPASWTAEVVTGRPPGGRHRRADHRTGSAAAVHGGPAPYRADTALAAGLAAVLDRVHAAR